ncbi:hypothetical protein N9Y81_01520 [Akkermansiaceae bacterium]|jgi:hypothetical protein|nr:hypothetical protein [Akkermansiaceae bacterium]
MKHKSILLLLIALLIPSLCVADDEAKPLPEFEKLLPSEKFFNKEALAVGHTYGFATNKSIGGIEKLLLKALGDGWKFKTAPADYIELINKNSEVKMDAVGNLSHDDFKKYSIGVTLVPIPKNQSGEFKGYKKVLSIVTVDLEVAAKLNSEAKKEAEQKKKDPAKPAPASKPAVDE